MELVFTEEGLPQAAKLVIDKIKQTGANVVAFYGKMGVGKTMLIKTICQQLGVIDTVQSPTFAIINQYQTIDGQAVFHFDFYRIDKLQDALNIGAEEYFYSGDLCLIEWPEIVEPILPENTLKIYLEEIDPITRKLTI